MSFKGKRNIYTCEVCHGHIVTYDKDAGTTPFMTSCHATEGCSGTMTSSMYRVYDQTMMPGWEWYRPENIEGLKPHVAEHVRMGGLLMRKFDGDNPLPHQDGRPQPSADLQGLRDAASRQQRRAQERAGRKSR